MTHSGTFWHRGGALLIRIGNAVQSARRERELAALPESLRKDMGWPARRHGNRALFHE